MSHFLCPFGAHGGYTNGLHPKALSLSGANLCVSMLPSPQAALSLSLSLLGSGVRCQITPDGCAGEAPSMRPQCLRLPVSLGPRNVPCSCLHVLLPAFGHCSRSERMEAVQDPCGMLHRVAALQGLVPSTVHVPAWDSSSRSCHLLVRGLSPNGPSICWSPASTPASAPQLG